MEKDYQLNENNNTLAIGKFQEEIVQIQRTGMIQLDEFDHFITMLPSAPDKDTVKRLLIELPSRLLYLQNQVLEFKKQFGDAKVTLASKKRLMELERSEIRKNEMDAYNESLRLFRKKSEEIMVSVMGLGDNASLKKTYLQEMIKVHAPSKPTKSDLDDIANVETTHLQHEIDELEVQMADFSIELEILNTKKDFYDNMWVTIRAYKGILVEEMRMKEQ